MATKQKGSRKLGRNLATCRAYALTHRQERNKLLRLEKHLRLHAGDASALEAVTRCKAVLGVR